MSDVLFASRSGKTVAAAFSFAAVLVPYFVFAMSGDSAFLTFWEFAANRYFQALNVLARDYDSIWAVQGIPMAIIQTWIMRIMQMVDPANLAQPIQLELFSQLTVLMAYFLSGVIVAGSWWTRSLRVADRITVLIATLALFPVTRWYHYFFAPDYWVNELPFYIFSTLWAISVIRRYLSSQLAAPRVAPLIFAGLWLALCFAQKPSLVGFGALPIVLHFCFNGGKPPAFALRTVILALATAIGHLLVMGALFNLSLAPAQTFIVNYWRWIRSSPSTGTSHVDLGEFLASGYTLNYPICIAAIVFVMTIMLCVIEKRRRALAALSISALYITLVAAGHVGVVYLRPSGTSVIDFSLFATATIPVCLAFLSCRGKAIDTAILRPRIATLRIAQVFAVTFALLFSLYPVPPRGYTVATPATTHHVLLEAIKTEADYVRALGRPAVVVIGDNRAQPRTIEALALYTGQLGLMRSERAPEAKDPPALPFANNFRRQILGDIVIVSSPIQQDDFLRSAIAAGHAVIWGSADNAPRTEDAFPQLRELTQRPGAIIRSFLMEAGGNRTAHIAYVNVPAMKPQAPVNVTAERISADKLRISWTNAAPLTFSRVQFGVDDQPFREIDVVLNQNSYLVHEAPAIKAYRFRVLAQAGVLVSEPSAEVTIQPGDRASPRP